MCQEHSDGSNQILKDVVRLLEGIMYFKKTKPTFQILLSLNRLLKFIEYKCLEPRALVTEGF